MRESWLLVLLMLWGQDAVRSISIIDLRVPAHTAADGEALLGCQFNLQDDILYSIKWYKDGAEFFRYIPRNPPDQTMMWFKRPGVTVDMSRSSSDVVTLINLKPESAGVYRCEISGEAPKFAVAADEKYVTIHVLPKSGPRITGIRYEYEIGDRVHANCSSPGSRPEALLKWLVNNKPVHKAHLRGPWHRVVQDPPDTTETVIGLSFMVLPIHYKTGVMQIKCQATIAPLYHREKTYILTKPEPTEEPELIPEETLPPLDPLDPEDFEPTEDPEDEQIKLSYEDKFRELANTLRLNFPQSRWKTTTIPPESLEGHATSMRESAVTILITVILLIIGI